MRIRPRIFCLGVSCIHTYVHAMHAYGILVDGSGRVCHSACDARIYFPDHGSISRYCDRRHTNIFLLRHYFVVSSIDASSHLCVKKGHAHHLGSIY